MITDLPILVLGPKYGAWVAAKVAFPYSTCKWLTSTSQNSNNISDAEKGTSCKKSTEQRHARGYMVCRDEPLCFFSLSERGWKRDGGCGCRIRMGRQGWCCPPQLFPAPAFWCHPLLGQVDSLYVSIWCLPLSLPTLKKSQFWQKLELQVGKEPIQLLVNGILFKKRPQPSFQLWYEHLQFIGLAAFPRIPEKPWMNSSSANWEAFRWSRTRKDTGDVVRPVL